MSIDRFMEMLSNFETSRVIEFLEQGNLENFINNPWFLGSVGAFALIALIMKWRLLLATIVSVAGSAGLMQYTLKQDTAINELNNESLIIFIAGGGLIAVIFIYLVFIKSD